MSLRFGTDGVRGRVPEELDSSLAFALGRAVAECFPDADTCVIGGDTRESTATLAHAFGEGIVAGGADVQHLGVIPTPGVAYAARAAKCLGAVISASHNPWHDNGIKVFAPGGTKLDDDQQSAVETRMNELLDAGVTVPPSDPLAVARSASDGYRNSLCAAAGTLQPRSVILDCANGASSELAQSVFEQAGCHVTVLHHTPDGRNINTDCGSTHPESLQAAVRAAGSGTIGFAFDGDADRVLAIDEEGEVVDGDGLLALIGQYLHDREELANDAIAMTIMSNLGVRRYLESQGIAVVETPVGDRSVAAAMETHGLMLGGEQSGHLILAKYATTGDGMLSALISLAALDHLGTSLAEFNGAIVRFPQILKNVTLPHRGALVDDPRFQAAVRSAEAELGGTGRVIVRASGTEPLLRIMVESESESTAVALTESLVNVATETLSQA